MTPRREGVAAAAMNPQDDVLAAHVRAARDGRWVGDALLPRLREQLPLLVAWTRKEYRARYRQSVLGVGWSVAQPLAMLAAFGVVLGGVLKVSSEGFPYIAFAFTGLVPWSFFASAVSFSATAMLNANPIISKVYFPREVIPLAHVATFSVDLVISSILMCAIAAAQGVGLSLTLIALVPVYAVFVILTGAIAVLLSTLTVFIRDLRYIVPLGVQMLFIASPIMYSATILPASAEWLNQVNPVAVVVTATRDVVLKHEWPDWSLLALHGAGAMLLLLLAISYVRSVEPRIADVA